MRQAAGRTIAHAALAAGAALAVCVLSALALLVTLICAAPLKAMAERLRDPAP
jgi:hypothetical protein